MASQRHDTSDAPTAFARCVLVRVVRNHHRSRGVVAGWETAEHPDPSGFQLRALQEHVRKRKGTIKFVFVECARAARQLPAPTRAWQPTSDSVARACSYMCLAQGKDRTPKDKAEFRVMLPNINLLVGGARRRTRRRLLLPRPPPSSPRPVLAQWWCC